MVEISKAEGTMVKALDARATRGQLISSNLANVDTPYYRPRDIDFGQALAIAARKHLGIKEDPMFLEVKTDDERDFKHFTLGVKTPKTKIFFRDGHMARNDGNSVDLDVENSEMAKNQIMYKAVTEAYKKNVSIFKSVITASEKLN